MIVDNLGYLNKEQVLEMFQKGERFSIYRTQKNTEILIKNAVEEDLHLYYPKEDRLPYKIAEGRKVARCKRIFNSKIDKIEFLNFDNWNNQNQIRAYEEFTMW